MITTDNNGCFGLDEIKKINSRNMGLNTVLVFSFVNDKRKLYTTPKHCFLTDENIPKISTQLKSGDKIWIDIVAFSADRSLI